MLKNNRYKNLLIFILIYFYILTPRLTIGVTINIGAISVAIVTVFFIVQVDKSLIRSNRIHIIAAALLFISAYHFVFASIYGNDPSHVLSISLTTFIGILFGWAIASLISIQEIRGDDVLYFLLANVVSVALLNSTIIFIEFIFPEVKQFIESYLLQSTNTNIDYISDQIFRLRGFASSGGASLSVFNAVAIIVIYFLCKVNKLNILSAVFAAFVISMSNIFTGRTGLIVGLFFLILLLFQVFVKIFNSSKFLLTQLIALILLLTFICLVLFSIDIGGEVVTWAFEWTSIFQSGEVESSSTAELMSMLFIPHSPLDVFIGVGFFEGVGKIYPRTDSGYLKTLLSLGLPLSVFVYASISWLFYLMVKVSRKFIILYYLTFPIMLFLEVKEPFLYQNFTGRFIFFLSGAALFLLSIRKSCSGTSYKFSKSRISTSH